MKKSTTTLLGAGLLATGLAVPMAASAHPDDAALAFIAGTAVGYVVGDRGDHVHYGHRRHDDRHRARHHHDGHGWHGKHHGRHEPWHRGWKRGHRGHQQFAGHGRGHGDWDRRHRDRRGHHGRDGGRHRG